MEKIYNILIKKNPTIIMNKKMIKNKKICYVRQKIAKFHHKVMQLLLRIKKL